MEIDPSQPLEIINSDPKLTFEFENRVAERDNEKAYTLLSVSYDGWRQGSISIAAYHDIINFCKDKIAERGTVV